MGIYIIKSLHANWFKLGHHKITEKRPNVYYRFINRGFYSCKCPAEIEYKVSFEDLELLYWFHNLSIHDEKSIHTRLRKKYWNEGEWYKYEDLDEIVNIVKYQYHGIVEEVTTEDYNQAKFWADNLHKYSSKFPMVF